MYLLFQQTRSFLAPSSNGCNGVNGVTSNGLGGVSHPNGFIPPHTNSQTLNNNVFENSTGLLSKRFSSGQTASTGGNSGLGHLGNLGSDLSTGLNPYEKWSNGSDKLFDQHTSDSILELSSKLLNLGMFLILNFSVKANGLN